jgi:hypothetical protein
MFFAREPPRACSAPRKHSRDSAAPRSAPGTHGTRPSSSGVLRFCRVTRAAQPRATQRAAGAALLPKRSAVKNPTQSAWRGVIAMSYVNARISTALASRSVSSGYRPVRRSAVAWAILTSRAAQLGRSTRPRAVRWPGAVAPRFSATRCVALSEREGTRRVSGRTLGCLPPNVRRDKHRRRHQRTCIVFATAGWQQRTFCAWAQATGCSLRESCPARSALLAKINESQPARAALLARTAPRVRDPRCRALAASHDQRSREPRSLPLARRFCQSVARPKIKLRAPGRPTRGE